MKHIFLHCLLFVFTTPVYANVLDVQKVQSASGIEAWLVEDHSIPVIAMRFSFRHAGSKFDPADKQGLARVVSNTMDEGAGDLDSKTFQKRLQDLSITLRFNSSRDNFGGQLKTLRRNQDEAFALLKLALEQPRFDEEPFKRMIEANKSRIKNSLSDPQWIAARIQNDQIYADHPYALNSGGALSTLDNITRADLKAFHQKFLNRNNLVIGVAGDITAEELSLVLDDVFGYLKTADTPDLPADLALQNLGQLAYFQKAVPQSVIMITQPGIARDDPDYEAAQVMNFILGSSGFGSRLTKEIREKRGLTYGIYSGLGTMDHANSLSISTSTANDNVPEMLQVIREEVARLKNTPISEDELTAAKSYLIGSLPLSLTSTSQIAGMLLSLQLDNLPIDYLQRRESAIQAMSIQNVSDIAQKLLAPDRQNIVVVGQIDDPHALHERVQIIETIPNAE